jgi:dihydrofolate reductase
MGRLVSITAIAVDGLADVTDWFVVEGDHMRESLDHMRRAEALVMGRPTYEGLAAYWSPLEGEWAERLNEMPKYVASRTLEGPLAWNATLLAGDAKDALRELKARTDGDLLLTGCGELACDLLDAGLIDEVLFAVHPALGGAGTRPFEGARARFELVDATAYDSGVTRLRYRPVATG